MDEKDQIKSKNDRKVINSELIASTPWLRLEELTYVDESEVERKWSAVRRTTSKVNKTDAVAVFAILTGEGLSGPDTLVCRQFRPAAETYTFELPAGLVDEGEPEIVTALRELKEETGYSGTVLGVLQNSVIDPGLSNVSIMTVVVHVDLNLPENHQPKTNFDPNELIETYRVKLNCDFLKSLHAMSRRLNSPIFTALEMLAFAISLALGKDPDSKDVINRISLLLKEGSSSCTG